MHTCDSQTPSNRLALAPLLLSLLQAISNAVVRRFPSFSFAHDDGDEDTSDTNNNNPTAAGSSAVAVGASGMMMAAANRPPQGQGHGHGGPWLDPEVFVAAAGEGDRAPVRVQRLYDEHLLTYQLDRPTNHLK